MVNLRVVVGYKKVDEGELSVYGPVSARGPFARGAANHNDTRKGGFKIDEEVWYLNSTHHQWRTGKLKDMQHGANQEHPEIQVTDAADRQYVGSDNNTWRLRCPFGPVAHVHPAFSTDSRTAAVIHCTLCWGVRCSPHRTREHGVP